MELHVSSKHRNESVGDTISRFGVDLLWSQFAGAEAAPANGYEIQVSSWSVPFTWYGIHAGNNVFVIEFTTAEEAVAVVIPPGNYTGAQLATYLTNTVSLLAADPIAFTVSYDVASAKFGFVSADAGQWKFLFQESPNEIPAAKTNVNIEAKYTFSAFKTLGLIDQGFDLSRPLTDDGITLRGDVVVNLMPIDRIHLEMNWPDVRSYDSRTSGQIQRLCQMSPVGPWGSFLEYTGQKTTLFRCHELPSNLQIALVDGDGRDVDLNGHDWYFTVSVYGLEGMTPMRNIQEHRFDQTQNLERMKIVSNKFTPPSKTSHDAPNRVWQGKLGAASTGQGNGANLNPNRLNNPFMSAN